MNKEIKELIDDAKWKPIEDCHNADVCKALYRNECGQIALHYSNEPPTVAWAVSVFSEPSTFDVDACRTIEGKYNPPTHFRPLPDDRLANVCEVLLEAVDEVRDTTPITAQRQRLDKALAKAEQIAGGKDA